MSGTALGYSALDHDTDASDGTARRRPFMLIGVLVGSTFVPTLIAVIAGIVTLNQSSGPSKPFFAGAPPRSVVIGVGVVNGGEPGGTAAEVPAPAARPDLPLTTSTDSPTDYPTYSVDGNQTGSDVPAGNATVQPSITPTAGTKSSESGCGSLCSLPSGGFTTTGTAVSNPTSFPTPRTPVIVPVTPSASSTSKSGG